ICTHSWGIGCLSAVRYATEATCQMVDSNVTLKKALHMSDIIKVCLDKAAPPELADLAKQLAVAENPANAPQRATPFEMAVDWRYLWRPGSTLSVRFLGGDPEVCEKVEHYAHQWEQFANIQFKFVQSGRAHIRIAFLHGAGSSSYLGTMA